MMDIKEYVKIIANQIARPLVVLDTETTGINVGSDEIIHFAAIKITPKSEDVKVLNLMIKPSKPINPAASEVNGIYDEDVSGCSSFAEYWPDIRDFVENCDIAGFNSDSFDIKMLSRQAELAGDKHFFKDFVTIDAFTIYKKHSTRKLGDAYRYYLNKEIDTSTQHSALADTQSCIAILASQIIKEKLSLAGILKKYQEENEKSGKGVLGRFIKDGMVCFGVHKNRLLAEVPLDYIKWVKDKSTLPNELKNYLKDWLKNGKTTKS